MTSTCPPEMEPSTPRTGPRRYHGNAGSHRSHVKRRQDTRSAPREGTRGGSGHVGYGLLGPRPGGVWKPVGRYPQGRSRTPSELRYQRTSTSGSRHSLDLAEVEADAYRDEYDVGDVADILDLNIDIYVEDDILNESKGLHEDQDLDYHTAVGSRTDKHSFMPVDESLTPEQRLDAMLGTTASLDSAPKRPPRTKPKSSLPKNESPLSLTRKEIRTHALDGAGRFLWAAIAKGNQDAVRRAYKESKGQYVDHHGNTALHVAARTGQSDILKWLLRSSGVDVTSQNARGETCGHVAAKHGHVDCLRHVIFCGSTRPLVLATQGDRQGLTPAHLAAIVGHAQIVRWLVNTFGTPVATTRNNLGQTPLHFAAAKGCLKSTETLSRLGDDVVNAKDDVGCTPVYYACQEGQVLTLRHLVDVAGASVSIATNEGLTPLQAAAQTGRVDIVHFLLQRGRGEVDLAYQTKHGATVFHMAAANGQVDILALLLTHKGADYAVRLRDIKGSACAHDAAENGHVSCLKLLYASGLDMHQPDEDGETPCTLAARSSNRTCAAFGEELGRRRAFAPVHDAIIPSTSDQPSETDSILAELQELDGPRLMRLIEEQAARYQRIKTDETSFIREHTMRSKDKRSLFRRLKDKFDEERQQQEAYEQKLKVLKKEFILRAMADTGFQGRPILKLQNKEPAPCASKVSGMRTGLGTDVIRERNTKWIPTSGPRMTPAEMLLQRTDVVPMSTTRSLRIMASQVRNEAVTDEENLANLLNSKSGEPKDRRTKASQEMFSPMKYPNRQVDLYAGGYLPHGESDIVPQYPTLSNVTTQTYASIDEVMKKANEMKQARQRNQLSPKIDRTPPQTLSMGTTFVGQPHTDGKTTSDNTRAQIQIKSSQNQAFPNPHTINVNEHKTSTGLASISPKKVPAKRGPKLKEMADYRPLKDKVSLEFESIPELDSNSSSAEKYSNHSSFEMHSLEADSKKQTANSYDESNVCYAGMYDYIPPPPSFQDGVQVDHTDIGGKDKVPENLTIEHTFNRSPQTNPEAKFAGVLAELSRRAANPTSPMQNRTPSSLEQENSPRLVVEPEGTASAEEPGQKKIHPRIDILRQVLEESGIMAAYLNVMNSQNPHKPQEQLLSQNTKENERTEKNREDARPYSIPQAPPPPPLTKISHFSTERLKQQADISMSPSPNSSQTSGYISPDMRTPPVTFQNPKVTGQQRKYSNLPVTTDPDVEDDGKITGNGNITSGRAKHIDQLEGSRTLWNVSLRRPPPKAEIKNEMSELERFFKLRKERTS